MLETGALIDGKYRVVRLLGRGGMGAVYEGHHLRIERRVAIKVLLPEAAASEAGLARFEREVRAAGRIGNDHILEIIDVGALEDGARYMVSEYLDGETLSSRLERLGPMRPEVLAPLMMQLLTGLGAAHNAGVLHRDLKPDNIFLLREKAGRRDFVKLIDFGISKFQSMQESLQMTATGVVVGTPYYLSPEQARGAREIDVRSDLYAVGVILYECLCGRVPFRAESFNELLFKIVLEEPRPLAELVPGIDPQFCALTQRAMAREPSARFQSARELYDALAQWLAGAHETSAALAGAASLSASQVASQRRVPTPEPRPMVTPSSFGRSAQQSALSEEIVLPTPKRGRVIALVGLGMLFLVVAGWALLTRPGPAAHDPTEPVTTAVTASEATPVAPVATTPSEPVAPVAPVVSVAPAVPLEPQTAATAFGKPSPHHGHGVHPAVPPATPQIQPPLPIAPPPPEPKPAPKAEPETRPEPVRPPAKNDKANRDFGY